MPPDRSFTAADVARLVARWAGGVAWGIEPATEGRSTPVYRLSRGSDVRYLRLAEEPGEGRIAEKRAHDLLRARGVLVPEVVWFDPAAPEVGRSAMVTTAIPGRPIDSRDREAAARQIAFRAGRDLALVNAIPVQGYGWVAAVDAEGAFHASHGPRSSWTGEYQAAAEDVAGRTGLDRALLRALVSEWATGQGDAGACLAHGDLDATHIYCQDGTYTGIIDFGEARGADAAYDLGHFLLHDEERLPFALMPSLLDGYRAAGTGAAVTTRDVSLQAVAIGVRALSRALASPSGSTYARWLGQRLAFLLDQRALRDAPSACRMERGRAGA